ncbi:MAG: hypothetical protein KatS3mg033_0855 [Thermonema sp.]|jgi:hypothetical protein|uniref:hypothetical protein n=1 Tax=Thermonema sp. TaxID=2231181 RepID=UPI0021DC004B|nr:hypothetical protein [Thermonema sp.]GIV39055.1 MAG: hypothetical protein KatS3mg033_0855 [Thermonema sp.]
MDRQAEKKLKALFQNILSEEQPPEKLEQEVLNTYHLMLLMEDIGSLFTEKMVKTHLSILTEEEDWIMPGDWYDQELTDDPAPEE